MSDPQVKKIEKRISGLDKQIAMLEMYDKTVTTGFKIDLKCFEQLSAKELEFFAEILLKENL
jgi:hypothetical protein